MADPDPLLALRCHIAASAPILAAAEALAGMIAALPLDERIAALNVVRMILHQQASPFQAVPTPENDPVAAAGLTVEEVAGDGVTQLLGRFAMDPTVIKTLGLCLTHTPTKRWFIGRLDGQVAGFGCLELPKGKKSHAHLRHSYILPEFRNRGVYTVLLRHRLTLCAGRRVLTVCIKDSTKPILEKHGFKLDPGGRQMAKYATLALDLRKEVAP